MSTHFHHFWILQSRVDPQLSPSILYIFIPYKSILAVQGICSITWPQGTDRAVLCHQLTGLQR